MRIGGEAPGGGPILSVGIVPCQLPVPATSDRQSTVRAEPSRERRIGKKMLFLRPLTCRTQDDALQCFAGGDKAPKRDEQLAASATIIVLRVPARLSAVRAWYHRASALSF
jgi:hypothetical protein